MNAKKFIVGFGIVLIVMTVALVVLALWALTQKQQRAEQTKSARDNRWKKDDPEMKVNANGDDLQNNVVLQNQAAG